MQDKKSMGVMVLLVPPSDTILRPILEGINSCENSEIDETHILFKGDIQCQNC